MATPCFEAGKYFQDGKDILDFCEPKEAACGVFSNISSYKISGDILFLPYLPLGVDASFTTSFNINNSPIKFPLIGHMPTFNSVKLIEVQGSYDTIRTTLVRYSDKITITVDRTLIGQGTETYTFNSTKFYKGIIPTTFMYEIQAAGGGGSQGWYNVFLLHGAGGSGGGAGAYALIVNNYSGLRVDLGRYGAPSSSSTEDGGDAADSVVYFKAGTSLRRLITIGGGKGGKKPSNQRPGSPGEGGIIPTTSQPYCRGYINGAAGGKGQSTADKESPENGLGISGRVSPYPFDSLKDLYGIERSFMGGSSGTYGEGLASQAGGGGGASFSGHGGKGGGSQGGFAGWGSSGGLGSGGGGGDSSNHGGEGGDAFLRIYAGYSA